MKERPILFSTPMVQAILAGNKTQTRRAIKAQPMPGIFTPSHFYVRGKTKQKSIINDIVIPKGSDCHRLLSHREFVKECPYGQVGDQLWVRETWSADYPVVSYLAGGDEVNLIESLHRDDLLKMYDSQRGKWRPSIHMPRWASRIQLEITNIRLERLFDLSEDDAMAEGCNGVLWVNDGLGSKTPPKGYGLLNSYPTAKHWFACLWDEINGSGSWTANPWVWVIEFKPIKPNPSI